MYCCNDNDIADTMQMLDVNEIIARVVLFWDNEPFLKNVINSDILHWYKSTLNSLDKFQCISELNLIEIRSVILEMKHADGQMQLFVYAFS
jgi:hypothetical protein